MKLTNEFIRRVTKEIKEEKDRVSKDIITKFEMTNASLSTLANMIEQTLRQNFPSMALPSLGGMPIGHTSNGTFSAGFVPGMGMYNSTEEAEAYAIVKGEHEVVTTMKRHLDFLKLSLPEDFQLGFAADQLTSPMVDMIFAKHFVYFDAAYYAEVYAPIDQQKGHQMTKPRIHTALEALLSFVHLDVRKQLEITSLPTDQWVKNECATYVYDHSSNKYIIELGSGLKINAPRHLVESCPELDRVIGKRIREEFERVLGINYNAFLQTNELFITFIGNVIDWMLNQFAARITAIDANYYYGENFTIVEDKKYGIKFSASRSSTSISIYIDENDLTRGMHKQTILISINRDQVYSTGENEIMVTFSGAYTINQCLRYIAVKEETGYKISFSAYGTSQSARSDFVVFHATEAYKLFVLFMWKFIGEDSKDMMPKVMYRLIELTTDKIKKD